MVFVVTPTGGVHRVRIEWLDALLPSGFRPATGVEIASWYEERGLEPPQGSADDLVAANNAGSVNPAKMAEDVATQPMALAAARS